MNMKKIFIFAIILLFSASAFAVPNPGHNANQIGSDAGKGTFAGPGIYTFPTSVVFGNIIDVHTSILNSDPGESVVVDDSLTVNDDLTVTDNFAVNGGGSGYSATIHSNDYQILRLYTTNPNSNVRISGEGTNTGGFQIESNGGSNYISFFTQGTEKARIAQNGNFGIGQTNPSQKLDVNGNIRSTGNISALGGITANGNIISGNKVCDGYGNCLDTVSGGGGGVWQSGIDAGDIYYSVGYVGIGDNDPDALLRVYDSNSASTANLAEFFKSGFSTDPVVVSDNLRVGIRDADPDAPLEVVGDVMVSSNPGGDGNIFFASTGGRVGIMDNGPDAVLDVNGVAGTPSLRVTDSDGDADTTPFLINDNGNVGIGTASTASAKLVVAGTAQVNNDVYAKDLIRTGPRTAGFTGGGMPADPGKTTETGGYAKCFTYGATNTATVNLDDFVCLGGCAFSLVQYDGSGINLATGSIAIGTGNRQVSAYTYNNNGVVTVQGVTAVSGGAAENLVSISSGGNTCTIENTADPYDYKLKSVGTTTCRLNMCTNAALINY